MAYHNPTAHRTLDRRSFLAAAGALFAPALLAGCSETSSGDATDAGADADAGSGGSDLSGATLTFVGDDAFAPYRSLELESDGTQKVVGLDIAVADEMAARLGFTYDFEAQDFAATLASVQASDTSFTMAMASNAEREQTYDFTQGYYQPLVGVLTNAGASDAVESLDALAGKTICCTEGTVQHKFVLAVLPDAEVHTFDGGDQCLQEVLSGRADTYVCDGAEGISMQEANPELTLGMLPREDTQDYVGVYRIMATKGASFISAFDACVGEMRADGTLDALITEWVGPEFAWGDADDGEE